MATRRGTGHGFERSDRVAQQIRRELADLLRFHLKDLRIAPRLMLVTLTAVELTPDYAHAKVFYTSMADPASNELIAQGLRHSATFLRRELGRRVRIHHVPELHFVFDPSVQEGARLSKLIDEAVESDKDLRDE
ncbi:MAG: 30S ribosome-binding factor RbfA [Sterolibacteriaceae bacterium]|uniref:30S ribosome-binding factor RbfA n=1 Tax=Sulfuritalea sp. TaxID=2480090 RepID=UPI001A3D8DD0|nr:30S ribosome-binding factor RbfA [Sulfuritalea sp.]MBL8477679.1 30S ribosome-binding factor RbfA [Sterolibacteriaceae bacterium]MBN8474189.1 30S ribosome-binding factor RbfA [Sulfuritalea sp.]